MKIKTKYELSQILCKIVRNEIKEKKQLKDYESYKYAFNPNLNFKFEGELGVTLRDIQIEKLK